MSSRPDRAARQDDEVSAMLKVQGLKKTFYTRKKHISTVLSDVSFTLYEGEKLALTGDSGTGKSTVARILAGLTPPDSGSVTLSGTELWDLSGKPRYLRAEGRNIQLVSQAPYDSLDPVQRVGKAVEEALLFSGAVERRKEAEAAAAELFDLVRLPRELMKRRPFALSGGQAQRVAVARALALSPDVLIADEATAMLDMTSQAQIAELLTELNRKRGLAVIFISHDASLNRAFADRILRLEDGVVKEV